MKNTLLISSLLLFIFSACNTHYVPSNNQLTGSTKLSKKQTVDENGDCWQECLMPPVYSDEITTYNVYTGDAGTEDVDLEQVDIEIQAAKTEWIKKKADRNCLSADPNDCLVWCLVEVPAEIETLTILKDTSQSTNFEVRKIVKKILVKKGGKVEKQKVICDEKLSPELVLDVQRMLEENKYTTGPPTEKLNTMLRASLNKYQRDHNLPIGLLNFQTLDQLGINYPK